METNENIPARVGYFMLYRLANSTGYLGAILITNTDGIPLEFKCTEAIKPDDLQRTLYGKKLEPHVAIGLCIHPLLHKVEKKPDILFVSQQFLLSIREEKDMPILCINPAENISDDAEAMIVLESHSEYETDKKLYEESIKPACRFSITEPFERIRQAVKILGEKDERFR